MIQSQAEEAQVDFKLKREIIQLPSTKFETLAPEKKNAILSESLRKSGLIMCIYLYMYITDRAHCKTKHKKVRLQKVCCTSKTKLLDS